MNYSFWEFCNSVNRNASGILSWMARIMAWNTTDLCMFPRTS